MIEAPSHLDDTARAKWTEVFQILAERNDIDQGTLDALAAYCASWSQWVSASATVAEMGAVIKSQQGFAVVNPFCGIAEKAQRQLRQWGDALKLTPKSKPRKKTKLTPTDPLLKIMQANRTADGLTFCKGKT